jgi:hypothetical protein
MQDQDQSRKITRDEALAYLACTTLRGDETEVERLMAVEEDWKRQVIRWMPGEARNYLRIEPMSQTKDIVRLVKAIRDTVAVLYERAPEVIDGDYDKNIEKANNIIERLEKQEQDEPCEDHVVVLYLHSLLSQAHIGFGLLDHLVRVAGRFSPENTTDES